ncbi:hypothetical protein JCM19992_02860 [Thermostilla marina]
MVVDPADRARNLPEALPADRPADDLSLSFDDQTLDPTERPEPEQGQASPTSYPFYLYTLN